MDIVSAPLAAGPRAARVDGQTLRSVAQRVLYVAVAIAPSAAFFPLEGYVGDWTREPFLRLVDPLLLLVAFLRLPAVARRQRCAVVGIRARMSAPHLAWLGFGGFLAWNALSATVHPSSNALLFVLRLLGVAGVVELISSGFVHAATMVVKTLGGLTIFSAALCVAQYATNGPVGLGVLGEGGDPFQRTAQWRAPTGFSYYPYPLSSVALLSLAAALCFADRGLLSKRWVGAISVAAGVQIGTGYSVTAVLTAVLMVVAFVVRKLGPRVRRFRGSAAMAFALFIAALGLTGFVLRDGWLWKGERSASTNVALASSGRSGQVEVGVEMIRRWPVVGIGQGAFAEVRDAHPDLDAITPDRQIVHSFALLVAIEAGLPALVFFVLAALAALWGRWRRNGVLVVALAGYAAGDLMYWYTGFGMLQVGLWLGLLLWLREERSATK